MVLSTYISFPNKLSHFSSALPLIVHKSFATADGSIWPHPISRRSSTHIGNQLFYSAGSLCPPCKISSFTEAPFYLFGTFSEIFDGGTICSLIPWHGVSPHVLESWSFPLHWGAASPAVLLDVLQSLQRKKWKRRKSCLLPPAPGAAASTTRSWTCAPRAPFCPTGSCCLKNLKELSYTFLIFTLH